MKAKYLVVASTMLAVLMLAVALGCTKARSDAQVASDVQNKIYSDAAIQSRQVTVQASNGVVTLSGYVSSDAERTAAASNAAQVEGVKTVVNNLQTASSDNAATQAPPQQPAVEEPVREEPAPAAQAPARRQATRERASARPAPRRPSAYGNNSDNQPTDYSSQPSAPVAAAEPPRPVAPPPPVKVTIPDGTTFSVRMIDSVDSETAQAGQEFRASLDAPIVVDDDVVVPAGADISGRVVDAKSAGRFAGKSALSIELTKLSFNGRTYSLNTNTYAREGSSRGATTAKRVGAGAAIGAIIGGIAGGGKGAAIGGTIGAGAGTGATAAGKGQQIRINSEQVLVFTLQNPLTVSASSSLERNRNRSTLND
ncbi:MAG TPA: BON domain-containing protein [Terriglobales bacterium]|nr:BON domain-containing protein [Terriglobales bacterium]